MIAVTLAVLAIFVRGYIMTSFETPSVDSGPNLFVTVGMLLIVLLLASLTTLTVSISDGYLRLKFGYGIFRKEFVLSDIVSAKSVRNPWYVGWGVRLWLRPTRWIYNVSGLDAVEITLKNGKIYRIGTDEPAKLSAAISTSLPTLSNI